MQIKKKVWAYHVYLSVRSSALGSIWTKFRGLVPSDSEILWFQPYFKISNLHLILQAPLVL